jgi:predicted O-methyltransferase YrrM
VNSFFEAAAPGFRERLGHLEPYRNELLAFGSEPPPAPRFEQDWFPRLDGAMAYALVREAKPRRIIEVGAGHSTRFMARAIADEGLTTHFTTIDPAPKRSPETLDVEFLKCLVQDVAIDRFDELGPGDILFIDSSHKYAPGRDMGFVLDDVLPRLPAGVLVHFHDIFLPDNYPEDWAWRGYSEQQALAPLLASGKLICLFSSHYVTTRMGDALEDSVIRQLSLPDGARETSLWCRTSPET